MLEGAQTLAKTVLVSTIIADRKKKPSRQELNATNEEKQESYGSEK